YVQASIYWPGYTYDQFKSRAQFRHFHRRVGGAYLQQLRSHFSTDKRLVQKGPQLLSRPPPPAAQLLPNARFIVMLRDPRAVLASDKERMDRLGRKQEVVEQAREFGAFYRRTMAVLPKLRGRLAIVRYESLVTDPAAVMAQVAELLAIRF